MVRVLPSGEEELPKDVIEKYVCAGKIAARVREDVKRAVREGMLLLEVCEMVEEEIRRLGGKPAFPCNISVNEVAAHYTSPPEDKRMIPEGALVKIDIGVHVDGYIADTATTVCFNPNYEGMVYAAEKALENALNLMRPGTLISKVSSEIQATIERFGFKPVLNLTGHEVDRYMIHAGKTIPNVQHLSMDRVRLGRVYAVEPFVTLREAIGRVRDGPEKHIFRLVKRRSLKDAHLQKTLKLIEENFKTLPFAERWIKRYFSEGYSCRQALSDLLSYKCLVAYPVFIEASLKPVAQAEHTVYISGDGPI
ncbi:MAG: type II methionyl aminopeptidase, partial [Candidatus Bathyarchaeota archaeon]|nr:type II methionyl aminopeptidase [Candidatus Bathyarchaeota archaeon]